MRCHEAFQGFFRRQAGGETPGYPRFKGAGRFSTACWDTATSWKVTLTESTRSLYLQGVGDVPMSKSARRQISRLTAKGGRPVTLTVTRVRAGNPASTRRGRGKAGWVWRATVGFADVAVEPTVPTHGVGSLVGGDRGVKVTLALSDGTTLCMPRHVAQMRDRIVELERARARKKKGSRSDRLLGRKIGRARRQAAGQVDSWARDTACRLVAGYDTVALEHLALKNMTKSAKGTIEQPGSNVAGKQGLNRELTDAALGRLAVRICVKAESAGRSVWMVNPANTSTTCSACGHTSAANRMSQAQFRCVECGHAANADVNAAVNIAARGHACTAAWEAAGKPLLARKPSHRRPRTTPDPAQPPATGHKVAAPVEFGAGSAPRPNQTPA